ILMLFPEWELFLRNSVILPICLFGVAGNGAVLWLLNFRICRNPITIYILTLALADFAFLFLMLPSTLFFLLEGGSCATVPSKYQKFLLQLSLLFFLNVELYLLTAISIERCTSILHPLWYRCQRPQRLSEVLSAILWALSIGIMATVISLCVLQKYCLVARICLYVINVLLFLAPMVISSTILFFKIKCGSQKQQPKRLDIVICLTVLCFLLSALPPTLWNFLQKFGYTIMSSHVVFLLICIHCSINPFIYFSMGRCWRPCSMGSLQRSLQRVFEEPEEKTASSNDASMDMEL
uniref:G-protein coupled receptors family 1 profile domain-containing protein n=1 Tax=Malurus cyaneus samueli TaxID=2593467 RepID=A0A8C5TRA4_9PASS